MTANLLALAPSFAPYRVLQEIGGHATCIVFHPNGHQFAVAGRQECIFVCDFATGTIEKTIVLPTDCQAEITALAYNSDGTQIACGTNKDSGKKVFVYNCDNCALIASFEAVGSVTSLEFNAESTVLTTLTDAQLVQQWNVKKLDVEHCDSQDNENIKQWKLRFDTNNNLVFDDRINAADNALSARLFTNTPAVALLPNRDRAVCSGNQIKITTKDETARILSVYNGAQLTCLACRPD